MLKSKVEEFVCFSDSDKSEDGFRSLLIVKIVRNVNLQYPVDCKPFRGSPVTSYEQNCNSLRKQLVKTGLLLSDQVHQV